MFKLILYFALFGLAALFILVLYVILKPMTEKIDCIALYTGGCGSGKSFFSVHQSLVLLRKQRIKVFFKNINPYRRFIKKKPKIPKPILLSNIPVRISLREWSTPLTVNPFVMQEKLPLYCVCFIDEVNLFLSQMDFKLKSEEQVNTSISLFRHFTKGYLVCNTQNVNKIHWCLRYCSNRSYNLSEFRKPVLGLPILAWVKCRNISIGDDIKTVEENDVNEGRRNLFAFFPYFGLFRNYDTYCYSEIVQPLPYVERKPYVKYKRNSFMKLDVNATYDKLLCYKDEFDCGGVGSEHVKPTHEFKKRYCNNK